jgi:hypothetical protein
MTRIDDGRSQFSGQTRIGFAPGALGNQQSKTKTSKMETNDG